MQLADFVNENALRSRQKLCHTISWSKTSEISTHSCIRTRLSIWCHVRFWYYKYSKNCKKNYI